MTRPLPTVPDLAAAPELAVLAALVGLLDIVAAALLAAHPELADDERPYWIHTPDIVPVAAHILRRAAARYRLAVTPPPAAELPTSGHDGHDEIPF